jgi:glycosyltransferase involved in cell wall biosynthesis
MVNYPIDVSKFIYSSQKEDFYLASARLLSYKRIDVIVKAFNQLGWKLIITGDGPERQRLEAMANDNITFLGYVSDEQRCDLLSKAKGVIVAALEDYGLVPIEANASGTPVISYGAGGVLDTQVSQKTGLFFEEQTPNSLAAALLKFQEAEWNYSEIRDHALNNFTETAFFGKVNHIIQDFCGSEIFALAGSN